MTQRHRPRFTAATSVDDDVRVQTRDTWCARVQAITNTNTISRTRTSNVLYSNHTDVVLIDRSKQSRNSRRDGRQRARGCRQVKKTADLGLTSSCVSSAAGYAYWRRVAAFAWSLNVYYENPNGFVCSSIAIRLPCFKGNARNWKQSRPIRIW